MSQSPLAMNRRSILTTAAGATIAAASTGVQGSAAVSKGKIKQPVEIIYFETHKKFIIPIKIINFKYFKIFNFK